MKIMKNWSLILICSFFAYSAVAQSVGFRGGVGWSKVYATDAIDALAPDFNLATVYSAGVVAEFPITDNFAFQPELAYARKGFSIQQQTDIELFNLPIPIGARAISTFGYLEAPLLAKMQFGNEVVKGYFTAGPSLGYAVDGNLETRTDGFLDIKLIDTDINLDAIDYQRFEVSGVLGAGVSFQTVAGKIFVDARYQHGFTELYDIPFLEEKVKNQGFGLNAGFLIPLR